MSARDAAVWLSFHLNEGNHQGYQVLQAKSLRETHILQTPRRDRTEFDGYGLGWEVRRQRGNCLTFHDGTIDGFRSTAWFDSEEDCAVFVSVNCGGYPANAAISRYLRQVLRADKPTDWVAYFDEKKDQIGRVRKLRIERERSDDPISTSRFSLEDFVGIYRHAGFGTLHIQHRADRLWFRLESYSRADGPLVRYSGVCFEHQVAHGLEVPVDRPKPLGGDLPWIQFHLAEGGIAHLDWHAWFGTARFTRCEVRRVPDGYVEATE